MPKYGGRQKGTPNKSSLVVREIIESALNNSLPGSIAEEILEIRDPIDRARVKLELMKYCYPQLKSVEHTRDNPLDDMSNQEKLEAFKNAVRFLESQEK